MINQTYKWFMENIVYWFIDKLADEIDWEDVILNGLMGLVVCIVVGGVGVIVYGAFFQETATYTHRDVKLVETDTYTDIFIAHNLPIRVPNENVTTNVRVVTTSTQVMQ